jgi:hypothetical protein
MWSLPQPVKLQVSNAESHRPASPEGRGDPFSHWEKVRIRVLCAVNLDTLAAAYANQSQFDRPAETASQAIAHAARLGETTFACEITRRLELYKTGRGYFAFRH